jgi:hypothetical protein
MKPHNVLKFWFWRAKLMVAGLPEDKEKITRIRLNDELSIELHPATGPDPRPFLKLCRQVDLEEQAINIYLKEVPPLIEVLPRAIAQLMSLGAIQPVNQLRTFRQLEILKKPKPEMIESVDPNLGW